MCDLVNLKGMTPDLPEGVPVVVRAVEGPCKPEVAQLQREARRQQQVLRLDVPVDNLHHAGDACLPPEGSTVL